MKENEQEESLIFTEPRLVYATFGARFWAAVVDGVFVFLAWFIVVQFFGSSPIGGAINMTIVLLYYPLMESGPRQATLGKTGMSIKVTDLEGQRITLWQGIVRHLSRLLSVLIVFAGYFMMLWDGRRQTLHDRMAGTLVIKT